ncbi:putative phosphoenolpyruvate synthase-like protein [Leptotrombidium deliense]|uniref:Putative phosphoenolpyruvate synthase-like protein n=1 Tax=Leptotrombidium deliense TaxID=299467 RepID=A0A443S5X1_9ACAR|nr:putative phosphoenolpyruvate synthase-like protein [Leptotrombidium deliense]
MLYVGLPKNKIEPLLSKGSLTVRGTAVTPLVTKGTAFVAPTLEDAKHIKNGDILITYSTDIGWSPYFPMLSAVVTEMGGLVSHGAVIAREFWLPCLVGVNDACQIFKTGDCVLVDGEKGTLSRIDEETC